MGLPCVVLSLDAVASEPYCLYAGVDALSSDPQNVPDQDGLNHIGLPWKRFDRKANRYYAIACVYNVRQFPADHPRPRCLCLCVSLDRVLSVVAINLQRSIS